MTLSFIQGNKRPHFGEIRFKEDTHKLELRSKAEEGEKEEEEQIKKIIDLKGKRKQLVCRVTTLLYSTQAISITL